MVLMLVNSSLESAGHANIECPGLAAHDIDIESLHVDIVIACALLGRDKKSEE